MADASISVARRDCALPADGTASSLVKPVMFGRERRSTDSVSPQGQAPEREAKAAEVHQYNARSPGFRLHK
jgi:hypothetical protein